MNDRQPGPAGLTPDGPDRIARDWDVRVERLLRRLPLSVTQRVQWLRDPDRRFIRLISGVLLVLGGVFSILPVLGLWMLPLGLALLAEDFPGIKPGLERTALWVERVARRFRSRRTAQGPVYPPKR